MFISEKIRGDDDHSPDIQAKPNSQDCLKAISLGAHFNGQSGHESGTDSLQNPTQGKQENDRDFELRCGHACQTCTDGNAQDKWQHSDAGLKGRSAIHELEALRNLDDGYEEGNTGQKVNPVSKVSVPPTFISYSDVLKAYNNTPKNTLFSTKCHTKTGS